MPSSHPVVFFLLSVSAGFVLGVLVYCAGRSLSIAIDRLFDGLRRTPPSAPSMRSASGVWWYSDAQILCVSLGLSTFGFDYVRARMSHSSTALAVFEAVLYLGGYGGCYAAWRLWGARVRSRLARNDSR